MPEHHQRFVLVVDDDSYIISVFKRVFERQTEYLLDVAMTIEAALQKIKVAQYDLIFLDMKLGRSYAGMEVLEELRRQSVTLRSRRQATIDSLVVIMTSSINLHDVMQDAHELGVLCFIDKPIPLTDDFIRRICTMLGLPMLPHRPQ